jgi:hypothetical protein
MPRGPDTNLTDAMTRRSRKLCVVAGAITLAAGLFFVLGYRNWHAIPRVDPATIYDEIRIGDTPDHVESLFGLPPGDYRAKSEVVYFDFFYYNKHRAHHPAWREMSWQFDKCQVLILLNEDGIIVTKHMRPGVAPRPFLQRVWDRVRSALPF